MFFFLFFFYLDLDLECNKGELTCHGPDCWLSLSRGKNIVQRNYIKTTTVFWPHIPSMNFDKLCHSRPAKVAA